MYVCICNRHRDEDIRAAAATGMRCARSIYEHLGRPARCGRCLDTAAKVIEEVHACGAQDVADASADDASPEAAPGLAV